jgi:hypothetical protein
MVAGEIHIETENFLANGKILKCVASGLRNYGEKDQELVGHPVDWNKW